MAQVFGRVVFVLGGQECIVRFQVHLVNEARTPSAAGHFGVHRGSGGEARRRLRQTEAELANGERMATMVDFPSVAEHELDVVGRLVLLIEFGNADAVVLMMSVRPLSL